MTYQVQHVAPNEAQKQALEALAKSRQDGKHKGVIVLATGAGKTILAALDTLQVKAENVLFVVHRNEIVYQAAKEFRRVHYELTENDIGFINGESKDFDKRLLFCTIQTLSRPDNLNQIASRQFDYVIIDECHHVGAETYKRVMSQIKAKFILGLTATPFRNDGEDVPAFFDGNTIFEMDLKKGIESKILVPFIYYGLYDNIDYSDIKWKGHKYSEKDLNKKLIIEERDNAIIREFKNHCGNRQTIGFCVSVRHANVMTAKFRKAGIKAVALTHQTPTAKRAEYIQQFRNKEFQVIFTKDIFNEGVDFPDIGALLFLRPTFSKVVFLQQLGRGLRKSEGKHNVLVLDFIGNYHNAYKLKEWISYPVIEGTEDRKPKPEFYYDKPQVWFDSRVINIWNEQERQIITPERLLYELRRLYNLYNRVTTEIIDKYSYYSTTPYRDYFGTINNALASAGLPLNRERDDERRKNTLIDNYHIVKTQLGRIPFVREMKPPISKHGHSMYLRQWGTWRKFLIAVGDIKQEEFSPTKSILVTNYKEVKKKIGRQPKVKEMKHPISAFSSASYDKVFGSWNAFLLYINEPLMHKQYKQIADQALIKNYWQLRKRLKRRVKMSDLEETEYSVYAYRNHFGGWRKFLQQIGECE